MIQKIVQRRLEAVFLAGASRIDEWPEHWLTGKDVDQGESYCLPCAEEEVENLIKKNHSDDYFVDGGWGTGGDVQAFCEKCNRYLGNFFTLYACEQEVLHFTDNGFDPRSADDCYSMDKVISTMEWQLIPEEKSEHYDALHKLYRTIINNFFWISNSTYSEYLYMWN